MTIVSETAAADVRSILHAFQDGYAQRSTATLDSFMDLFAPDATLEVIGTSAATPADDEWCLGRTAVRTLVVADWQSWGDLTLDVAGATIHVRADVAWLSATGRVSQTIALT